MSSRRTHAADAGKSVESNVSQPPARRRTLSESTGDATRIVTPATRAEAEERYVTARTAWIAAMRASSSGRPADLASLAIAQEAYEAASAEREHWISGKRVAMPLSPGTSQRGVDAAVGQALAWQRVRQSESNKPGILGRIAGKLRGR